MVSKKTFRWWGLALLLLLIAVSPLAWGVFKALATTNEYAVIPGEVYRSGQMSADRLGEFVEEKGIETVINLRGHYPEDAWYQEEKAACEALGIGHHDIHFVAGSYPDPREVRKLLDLFDRSPYPILLHCRNGADRSGWASALYLIEVHGMDVEKARRGQLHWSFGHIYYDAHWNVDKFFPLYRESGKGHSIREWLDHGYREIYEGKTGKGQSDSQMTP